LFFYTVNKKQTKKNTQKLHSSRISLTLLPFRTLN